MKQFKDVLTKDFLYTNLVINKLKQHEVAKIVGCTQTVISKYARRFNIELINHKLVYNTNEHYFKTWSSNMAYILGFITADGYIYERKNALRVELKDTDIEILKFIIGEISPNNRIIYRSKLDNRTGKIYNQYKISISSKILINDLNKLGVMPRKSGKEYLPQIPQEFIYDYLRGYFDGDGCFYIGKYPTGTPRYCLSIASSSNTILDSINKMIFHGNCRIINKKNCYTLIVNNSTNINKICSLMYNGNFCLQRKKDKYIEFLKYINR